MSHFERVYMILFKKQLSAVISCLLLSAVSLKALAAEVVLTEAQIQAMNLLETDLLAAPGGVRPLGKTTRLYSYFRGFKDSVDPTKLWPTYLKAATQPSQYNADLSFWAGAFWNPANNTTDLVNGGPGWYLAIEPVISEKYGDTYYIADFPAATQLIDVTDPTWKHISKIKLKPQTLTALVTAGIIRKSQIGTLGMQNGFFTRLSMQNIAHIDLPIYRKVVTEIFKKNNIQLVAYTWEKTGLKVICKKASSTALVFIGSAPAPESEKQDRATVSAELVNELVVNYTKGQLQDFEYSAEKIQRIEDSQKLYSAIKSAPATVLTADEVQRLKSVTFDCE